MGIRGALNSTHAVRRSRFSTRSFVVVPDGRTKIVVNHERDEVWSGTASVLTAKLRLRPRQNRLSDRPAERRRIVQNVKKSGQKSFKYHFEKLRFFQNYI